MIQDTSGWILITEKRAFKGFPIQNPLAPFLTIFIEYGIEGWLSERKRT